MTKQDDAAAKKFAARAQRTWEEVWGSEMAALAASQKARAEEMAAKAQK